MSPANTGRAIQMTVDGHRVRRHMCRRRSDMNTANRRRYYGVCPDCIGAVKADGCYFEER